MRGLVVGIRAEIGHAFEMVRDEGAVGTVCAATKLAQPAASASRVKRGHASATIPVFTRKKLSVRHRFLINRANNARVRVTGAEGG